MNRYSIIIPCAGRASRLNIPFSKALFPVASDQTLIDNIFRLFQNIENKPRFIIVINDESVDIVKYLYKYCDDFNISFVFQKKNEYDLIGAIKSASFEFSDYNMVLLPDTTLVLGCDFDQYIHEVDAKLKCNEIVFTVTTCLLDEKLYDLGVIIYDIDANSKVTVRNIIDKPKKENLSLINKSSNYGAWASFTFTREIALNFLNLMEKNISGKEFASMDNSLLESMSLVFIKEFTDLGEWCRIYEYFKQSY